MGGGQGGLEFVIPGRVCGRNAGPGIGGKRSGSRRKDTRLGFSDTSSKEKTRPDSAGHNPVGRKGILLLWTLGGFRCDWLGLRLGPRPTGPTQRARMEKRKKIGLVGDPSLANA